MARTWVASVVVLILVDASAASGAEPLRFVLTGNAEGDEVGLDLGCTYQAIPPYSNPGDPENKRLVDRDRPYADWNTTTGLNRKDQNVIFDLSTRCRIDEVSLYFDRPQKPASVAVFVGENPEGPWESVGKMRKNEQKQKWWRLKMTKVSGRYVRLFHTLDAWGWYLREVKMYGNVLTGKTGPGRADNGELILVDNGAAHATIVVADEASSRILDAAVAFQRIASDMTGVWLPIESASAFNGKSAPIYIGDSEAVREKDIHIKQDASDGDHYVIQTGDGWLALVGNDAPQYGGRFLRSSVYAVYHLFETLGCGWFGPDPLWQVIPETQTLSVLTLSIDERPAFLWRRVWMHRMNSPVLRDAWREGGIVRAGGHAYDRLVPPEKHKDDHPEWFGEGQPDITNPEVIQLVVEKFQKKIDEVPEPIVVPFSLSANDRGGWVHNERTERIGNISSQQLYFANSIARELNKTHPGRFRFYCLAYWFSHAPPKPMRKAEPGVQITIVNEGNHTKPLDMPEAAEIVRTTGRNNTREIRAIEGWLKTGGLDGVYEWYIPAIGNKLWADVPWYPGETTLRNLRYWKERGIKFVYYEAQRERNGGFPLRWPVYYRCYRGMWDPELTAEQILTGACKKLYGPAATAMTKYYGAFEKAMLETDEHGGNWHLPRPDKVYTPAVEARGDRWIAEAEKAADNEMARKRIAAEKVLWSTAKSVLAQLRNNAEAKTYTVVLNGKRLGWKGPTITRTTLIELYGLPKDVQIEVVEKDAQNRRLKKGAKIELTRGVVFRTVEQERR